MKPRLRLAFPTRQQLACGALAAGQLLPTPVLKGMAGAWAPSPMAPKITRQPASVNLYQGQALALTVTVEAYPAATYQWRRNGANLQGATSTQFSLPAIQPADTGRYEVVVNNRLGHVTSQTAVVALLPSSLPSVLREPVNVTSNLGETASFSVVVAGTPAPTYQWRKDGAVVPGATGAILTLYQVQPSDEGAYDVLISNLRGAVLSRAATLRVMVPTPTYLPPRIATPPASMALAAGGRAVLAVAATGDALSYQWRRNGAPLAELGVRETVPDPRFELWVAGVNQPILKADDWSEDTTAAVAARTAGAFPLAAGSRDAARVVLLPPGTYTIVAEAADGLAGVVLVEVYDLEA